MSFLRRSHPPPEPDTDEENDENIDPELRLRTVRTAASAIAESIRSEQRAHFTCVEIELRLVNQIWWARLSLRKCFGSLPTNCKLKPSALSLLL
jgi:hypothetical protein